MMLPFPSADAWKPLVRRWIGPRRPPLPPLILPLVTGMPCVEAKPAVSPTRPISRREEPAELAPIDARQITDEPSVGDEAIRTALAGIAAELAASETGERKRRWPRFAVGAGAVVTIGFGAYVVLQGRGARRDAFTKIVATNPTAGRTAARIKQAEAIKPPSVASRPVAPDTSAPSSDTSSGLAPTLPANSDSVMRASLATEAAKAAAKQSARAATTDMPLPRIETTRAPVSAVVVLPTSVRVGISRRTTLTATIIDEFGEAIVGSPVSWTSSMSRVATVSSKGVVTGLARGTTKITVTSGGKTASAFVTVTSRSAGKQRR
jgi:hypothetical protein